LSQWELQDPREGSRGLFATGWILTQRAILFLTIDILVLCSRGLKGLTEDIDLANKLASHFRHDGSQLTFVLLSRPETLNEGNYRFIGRIGVRRIDVIPSNDSINHYAPGDKNQQQELPPEVHDERKPPEPEGAKKLELKAEVTETPAVTTQTPEAEPVGYKVLQYHQFLLVLKRMQAEADVAAQIQMAQRNVLDGTDHIQDSETNSAERTCSQDCDHVGDLECKSTEEPHGWQQNEGCRSHSETQDDKESDADSCEGEKGSKPCDTSCTFAASQQENALSQSKQTPVLSRHRGGPETGDEAPSGACRRPLDAAQEETRADSRDGRAVSKCRQEYECMICLQVS
jgi:hypothetical protein